MDKFPNMSVEIAARIGKLGRQPRMARKFFDKYQDRILFGTDAVPLGSPVAPEPRRVPTPESNHAPHRVPAPWLHAQWRGKVAREEKTTAWCSPRFSAGGQPSPVSLARARPARDVSRQRSLRNVCRS